MRSKTAQQEALSLRVKNKQQKLPSRHFTTTMSLLKRLWVAQSIGLADGDKQANGIATSLS
eukprot:scaffold23796_cov17-Prasinocladus_malaysianus.AAC.2